MTEQKLSLKQGRRRKDPALALRDRYWALYLKSQLPDESYASLERMLLPHLHITRREHGEGFAQPGALSKAAAGTRGVSAYLEGLPDVVRHAEALVPGAIAAYSSALWSALVEPHPWPGTYQRIAPEVQARLLERHFFALPAKPSSPGPLSLYGVRRVSRIWHLDALGLLLCHCPAAISVSKLSLTAEAYVPNLLHWICQRDPALMAVKDELAALITRRYGITDRVGGVPEGRIFLAPKVSAVSQGLRLIFGS